MDFKEWYRGLNVTAKLMIVVIILLVIAIATRWNYVRSEAATAVKERLILDDFRQH